MQQEELIEKQDCDEVDRIVSLIDRWNLDNLSSQQNVITWQATSDFSSVIAFLPYVICN